ncbi:MAG: EFR1 family ferrodoxin [Roseburia sp.]|nr:EFR1 family ferrodoxin [Roseburia sp.]
MKIRIFYFSGTGNTQKIADEYRAAFEADGNAVDVCALPPSDAAQTSDIDGYDLIGIGYPIHSFNAPKIILDLCKRFPKRPKNAPKKCVFIFKTSGEPVRMSDVSSLKMRAILKRRGYDVRNEYQYVMPYNIIFRHSDAAAYKMWQTAKALVPIDVREIASEKSALPKRMFMGGFLAWVLRIEHGGARINGVFFRANKRCVKCGLCVKACPADNIRVNKKGKIKFGGKCMMCMRCSMGCPKNAVEIGLFKKWKVNGAYSFDAPIEPDPPDKHAKYCAKAYARYYAAAESKIRTAEMSEDCTTNAGL